jgi:hypothetical protein
VSTTRAQVLDAIELAIVILGAINPGGGRREDFVEVCGIDPDLINQGRGRRAARVLQGVVAVMRERAAPARGADQRVESITDREKPKYKEFITPSSANE